MTVTELPPNLIPIPPYPAPSTAVTVPPSALVPSGSSYALRDFPSAKDAAYGAKGTGRMVSNASTAVGSNVVTCAGAFTASVVGDLIGVPGAGFAGANILASLTGITDASHATMSVVASTAVGPIVVTTGPDDTTGVQSWLTFITTNHMHGILPQGFYMVNGELDIPETFGWGILGAGDQASIICQCKDNVPVLNLGASLSSSMHSYVMLDFQLTYLFYQPPANTAANPILFSKMGFQGEINRIWFQRGSYAIKVVPGISAPWGQHWDNLVFNSSTGDGLSLGAMDWTGTIGAIPNNHWGRFYVVAFNMAGPIFNQLKGYNWRIGTIEIIEAQLSPIIWTNQAGVELSMGTIKVEAGTYTVNNLVAFQFSNASIIKIDQLFFSGVPMVLNIPGGQMYLLSVSNGSVTGDIDIGLVDVGFSTVTAGTGYVCFAGNTKIRNYHSTAFNLWNTGSTAAGETITVDSFVNNHMSQNKGDADYTVSLNDPNIVVFNTPFTASRVITLPGGTGSGQNALCNGLYYELVFDGAINGVNTAVIKVGATTILTQITDKVVLRFTYRRSTVSAAAAWVLTKYDTALPI